MPSTFEALDSLCTSIPEWNSHLDELNGQIALQKIKLARLTEGERLPTRLLKNKGSTESLRPNDGGENPFLPYHSENLEDVQLNPFDTPESKQNGVPASQQPGSPAAARAAAGTTPPPLEASSNPRPAGTVTQQSSHPTPPTQKKASGTAIRGRKIEFLASGDSVVYYDSAVQQAFRDLVELVSRNRNAIRKVNMYAKMEELMEDSDDNGDGIPDLVTNSRNLQKHVSVNKQGASTLAGIATTDSDNEANLNIPRLRFASTREMGPSRSDAPRPENTGKTFSVSALNGYRRGGTGSSDIFDALEKGLEWVQGQCEYAAHQFLREGECSTEIANIKRRLAEVKETASKEIERLKDVGMGGSFQIVSPDVIDSANQSRERLPEHAKFTYTA